MAKTERYYGTGRRKKSIARVYLVPGNGNITINKRSIDEYFGLETLKVIVRQPLAATETAEKFDVLVNVRGGGYTGQAGAIRHGISRALLQVDGDFRPVLKLRSSARDNLQLNNAKKPGNTPFPGLFLYQKFCLDCSVLMEFERKFMAL